MLVLADWYYNFKIGSSAWDSAYHSQTLWGLLHGSLSPSVLGANFITDHCFFLSFLLAPLYWIWPSPLLLLYLKVGGFLGGAYIFFLIVKKYLHPLIALGGMIAFILAPANISLMHCAFNYEPFSIPLVFLIFKSLDENRFRPYILCCLLLALLKEQMPLLVIMFGIYSFFFKKEERIKWALAPLLIGLTIFILEIFVVMPHFRKDLPLSQGYYWTRYMQYGKTPPEILFFLFTHPVNILNILFSPPIVQWYNGLFGVWGELALFSPHILLIALPLFLKNILSNDPQEHLVTTAYYAATFTPFIFLASWNTLNHIRNKWRLPIHALALSLMFIHTLFYMSLGWPNSNITGNTLARIRLIERIPPEASVLSSWATLPALCNRKELYPFQNYLTGSYHVSGRGFELPEHTDYLLLDFADEWLINRRPNEYIPKVTALNFDNRWRLQESIEDIALYAKNPSRQKADRLIERSFKPFPVKNTNSQIFDDTITLEGIDFPKTFPQKYRIFPLHMYWKCLNRTTARYDILINITDSKGKSYYIKRRPIGSTIYPTYFWKKKEHIKESYFYLLPPMPQGNFGMKISVYNAVSKKWIGKIEENFSVS